MNLVATNDILEAYAYIDGVKPFIAAYGHIWDSVRCQVLKLETRQTYVEINNPSHDLWIKGQRDAARALIVSQRESERERYDSLASRGVDFIRCRPIAFPASDYLQWEIENYRHNATMGERIFWCNLTALREVFETSATHDLLIFDARLAAVTKHDEAGEMLGGWVVDRTDHILRLLELFMFIKSQSSPLAMLPRR